LEKLEIIFYNQLIVTLNFILVFNNIYKDKKVLLTGHTGFKGSWLALWLHQLGAKVIGYSKDYPSEPTHFQLLNLEITSIIGDIRDRKHIQEVFNTYQPDIVFHLAAQALVRYSYIEPVETFETNVMGTINMYECALQTKSVKAFVNITSDKAYENKERLTGYKETDPMGGHDPYSASKGCAELVTSSYRNSFFQHTDKLLASARAGNVIGGGDWALDRLVPDIFKATSKLEKVTIRNIHATRPWQHVLEPLSGYLLLGQLLLEGNKKVADGWNFGPDEDDTREVSNVIQHIKKHWEEVNFEVIPDKQNLHEANLLKLDCAKAAAQIQWKPVWHFEETIAYTTNWYKDYYSNPNLNIQERSLVDLNKYMADAKAKGLHWSLK
jgi:CDP-glucose 4,6-dehydratase